MTKTVLTQNYSKRRFNSRFIATDMTQAVLNTNDVKHSLHKKPFRSRSRVTLITKVVITQNDQKRRFCCRF